MKHVLNTRIILNMSDTELYALDRVDARKMKDFLNSKLDAITKTVESLQGNQVNETTVELLKKEKTQLLAVRNKLKTKFAL